MRGAARLHDRLPRTLASSADHGVSAAWRQRLPPSIVSRSCSNRRAGISGRFKPEVAGAFATIEAVKPSSHPALVVLPKRLKWWTLLDSNQYFHEGAGPETHKYTHKFCWRCRRFGRA
jgi:hypothetical protein